MYLQPCHLLQELLQLTPGIVCISGAGGKTSLLHALGEGLAGADHRVLCTTTTRMLLPESTPLLPVTVCDDPAMLVPPQRGLLAARSGPSQGNMLKVYGYTGSELDALHRKGFTPWILVESDGAARRCIKAPAEHEPVIPILTRCVIGVLGLSCLFQPCTSERVFRLEQFCAVTGLAPGDAITPQAVARLITHPQGIFKGAPPEAHCLLFCNQVDLPGAKEAFIDLAQALLPEGSGRVHACYAGALRKDGLACVKYLPGGNDA